MRCMEILQKEPASTPDFGEFESYTAWLIFPTMFAVSIMIEAR